MANNEKTGKGMGKIANKALLGKKLTKKETQSAGGSLTTQFPDKKKTTRK